MNSLSSQAAQKQAEIEEYRHGFITDDGLFAGLLQGDSATMLKTLPNDAFNVAITSPPYYWVRDYGYDGQLGHEASVEAYVEALMDVLSEANLAS